jgi:hypothetical protein
MPLRLTVASPRHMETLSLSHLPCFQWNPLPLNSAQLSYDGFCRLRRHHRHRLACIFPPFFFPRSAHMSFPLCAEQEILFVFPLPRTADVWAETFLRGGADMEEVEACSAGWLINRSDRRDGG